MRNQILPYATYGMDKMMHDACEYLFIDSKGATAYYRGIRLIKRTKRPPKDLDTYTEGVGSNGKFYYRDIAEMRPVQSKTAPGSGAVRKRDNQPMLGMSKRR